MRALIVLAACGAKPAPPPAPPPPPEPAHAQRVDLPTPTLAMGLALHRDTLIWADEAGAIWTMPATGGTAQQLSEQHKDGFAFHPFVAGDRVYAKVDKD